MVGAGVGFGMAPQDASLQGGALAFSEKDQYRKVGLSTPISRLKNLTRTYSCP